MVPTAPEYTRAVGMQRYANSPAKTLIYQTGEQVPENGKKCMLLLSQKHMCQHSHTM